MPRVRIIRAPIGELPFFYPGDRSGNPLAIPLARLVVTLVVIPRDAGEDYRPEVKDRWSPDAILDTGAPLTLFPYPVWQPFESAITWLAQPPLPAGGQRRVTILGGSWAYRLGRVRIGMIDTAGGWLAPAWTNAWFLDDDPVAPKQAVLGLRTGLFDGRQLRSDSSGEEWWLEDA